MYRLFAALLALSLSACASSTVDTRASDNNDELKNQPYIPDPRIDAGPPQPGVYGPTAPYGPYGPGLYGPAAMQDSYGRPRGDCTPKSGRIEC